MLLYANYDTMVQEEVKFRKPELQDSIENEGATNMVQAAVKMEAEDEQDEEEEDEDYETHDSGKIFEIVSLPRPPSHDSFDLPIIFFLVVCRR